MIKNGFKTLDAKHLAKNKIHVKLQFCAVSRPFLKKKAHQKRRAKIAVPKEKRRAKIAVKEGENRCLRTADYHNY